MKRKWLVVASVIAAGLNCGVGLAGFVLFGGIGFAASAVAGAVWLGLFAWANK